MLKKRSKVKTNLEDSILADSGVLGHDPNNTFEDDMNEVKLLKAKIDLVHQMKLDEMDESRKEVEYQKSLFDFEEAKRKSARDEDEYKRRIEREDREAADREAKANEKAKLEAKEKKSEKRWKHAEFWLKVGGIAAPIAGTLLMFFRSMNMEYRDEKIPTKEMRDLKFKLMKH